VADQRLIPPSCSSRQIWTASRPLLRRLCSIRSPPPFLIRAEPYHLRCKVKCGGVWSEWSETFTFEVSKPASPTSVVAKAAPGGGVQLQWKGETGTEHLVFGSNRLDFLPELYAPEEIVRLHKLKVIESRPNKNLLATTSETQLKLPVAHRFYRSHRPARRGALHAERATPCPRGGRSTAATRASAADARRARAGCAGAEWLSGRVPRGGA
jgi:hypothetical protein